MSIHKKTLVIISALLVVAVGASSSLFVNATQLRNISEYHIITINNNQYQVDELFLLFEQTSISTKDGEQEGVSLASLIYHSMVLHPENYQYTIKAKDYQQTVQWAHMLTGVLSKKNMQAFFPDLAQSFWVYDIIEIEVNLK